ncbi:MAG: PQQ-like beta-propeller repeat protein [Thermoplasmata archaeon]|nr:MAG: PQQ-like beta-propeller repeat protein [Thermoplasmata archaeon]
MKINLKGKSVLTVVVALGIVAGLAIGAIVPMMGAPAGGSSPEASVFRYDLKRTGNSGLVSDITTPSERWIFDSGSTAGSMPEVGDINGDGRTEVVWGSGDGVVYALNENGQIIWTYQALGPLYASPGIGDVDGDGKNEVVIGGYLNNGGDPNLYALNGEDGSLLWLFPTAGIQTAPTFYDVNSDGTLDVLIGSMDYYFYALNGPDGSIIWKSEFEHFIRMTPPVGDIDKDGIDELLVADNHAVTRLFEVDGSLDWEINAGYGMAPTPIFADVDGDGWDEIITFSFGWWDRGILGAPKVYNHDGTLLWTNEQYTFFYSLPTLYDVDGDGLADIINVDSDDQVLIAYRGTDGTILYTAEPFEKNFMQPGLTTADIDGDGEQELLVSGNPNLFSINAADGSVDWVYDSGGERVYGTLVADLDGDGLAEILLRIGGRLICLENGFDPFDLLDEIIEYILNLEDECFKNNADNRKNALVNKLEEVREMILSGDYEGAINKLKNDIRAKMDGQVDGDSNNDWIICQDAQEDLTEMIDRLVNYLESLL